MVLVSLTQSVFGQWRHLQSIRSGSRWESATIETNIVLTATVQVDDLALTKLSFSSSLPLINPPLRLRARDREMGVRLRDSMADALRIGYGIQRD